MNIKIFEEKFLAVIVRRFPRSNGPTEDIDLNKVNMAIKNVFGRPNEPRSLTALRAHRDKKARFTPISQFAPKIKRPLILCMNLAPNSTLQEFAISVKTNFTK